MPNPAPMRALAERTSKPLDDAGTASASSAAAGDLRPATGGAVAPNSTSAPDQPARAVDAAPVILSDVTGDAEEPAADLSRAADGATPETHAGPTVRDAGSLSTLSRATIDATAQIAAQILRKLEGRSTRFEMALTPDDLGRVDVRLDIDAEGRLAARLAFDNPAAATDLRGRADELRRQLEDAGFHLADDAFEFAERDSGSSAFDRGQDERGGHKRAFAAAARLNAEIDVAQPPRWMALSLSPSGVDMKV
jgi:flagellar hook-length control protein FliK